jgi:hypothetical protein
MVLIAAATAATGAVEPIQEPAPLSVGIDSVEINLRVEPAGTDARSATTPALVRPDHRLTVAVPLPVEATLLSLHDVRLLPATTDSGERVGLLYRVPGRIQTFSGDSQANRDRVLRLVLNLTPPFASTGALHRLRGWFTVDLGWGRPLEDSAAPATGSTLAGGRVTIGEITTHSIFLTYAADVFLGDGHLALLDRDGKDLRATPYGEPVKQDGGWKQEMRLRVDQCAKVRVEWFAKVTHETLDLDIADLPIPGGLPGVGALDSAVPRYHQRPMVAKVAQGPLETAIDGNHQALARQLIMKADREVDLGAALQIAVGRRQRALATLLLDHGAPVGGGPSAALESSSGFIFIGCPPLLIAANNGDPGMVELLLARGADPEVTFAGKGEAKGWTALHAAVAGGDGECVHALMGAGCDPDRLAADGRSVLFLARDLERWRLLHDLLGNLQ